MKKKVYLGKILSVQTFLFVNPIKVNPPIRHEVLSQKVLVYIATNQTRGQLHKAFPPNFVLQSFAGKVNE